MATEPTPQSTHWLLSLAKHFDHRVWPWLIRALRHDPIVWEALEKHGMAERGLAALSGDPKKWSPAVLALMSLDLSAPLESLRSLPLRPVSQAVHERALKTQEKWVESAGSGSLNLGQAVLIALALREDRLGSSWDQVFASLDLSHPGWQTIISCLYGIIPDPFDMLRAFMQPGDKTFQPQIVVHTLLSNPLSPDEQGSALRDLLKALPADQRKAALQILSQVRKQLAVEIAQDVLDDRLNETSTPHSLAVSKSLPTKNTWSTRLAGLQDTLDNADFYITAGQEAQALPMISEAITSTRRIQAGLSAYLAELVSTIGNPESAVEAWRQAAQMEPENPLNTAGLVQSLLDMKRVEDARTILDLHLADLDAAGMHPVLVLAAAQLAVTEGHLQDARNTAEQVFAQLDGSPELKTSKNLAALARTLLAAGLPNLAELAAGRGIQND
ncbi:MAG TPA: tetratricopeptide repeat protein, partial [Anaerolineales bacterium]|nr:tetratricopeptide repeat protein [Anaerolineales bacterium]